MDQHVVNPLGHLDWLVGLVADWCYVWYVVVWWLTDVMSDVVVWWLTNVMSDVATDWLLVSLPMRLSVFLIFLFPFTLLLYFCSGQLTSLTPSSGGNMNDRLHWSARECGQDRMGYFHIFLKSCRSHQELEEKEKFPYKFELLHSSFPYVTISWQPRSAGCADSFYCIERSEEFQELQVLSCCSSGKGFLF